MPFGWEAWNRWWAGLEEDPGCDEGVIGAVAGEMEVLNESVEHCAAFSPVISGGEQACHFPGLIAIIVGDQAWGEGWCGRFDGVWDILIEVFC